MDFSSPVNKDYLRQLIEANGNLQQQGYTADSWARFNIAYTEGKVVLDNDEATQFEVDNAVEKLLAAIDGLVKRETNLDSGDVGEGIIPKPEPDLGLDDIGEGTVLKPDSQIKPIPNSDSGYTNGESGNVKTGGSLVLYPMFILFLSAGTLIGVLKSKMKLLISK